MRLAANIPEDLWQEIWETAVHLYNRTPRRYHTKDGYIWASPYERLHEWLRQRDGQIEGHIKPQIDHLRAFGCKAYSLTSAVKKDEIDEIRLPARDRGGKQASISRYIPYI